MPEVISGIIIVKYKTNEFLINGKGRIYDYKTYSGRKITKWQQYAYGDNGDLKRYKDWYPNDYREGKWRCRTTEVSLDKVILEKDKEGNEVASTFYLNGGLKTRSKRNQEGFLVEYKEYKAGVVIDQKQFDEAGRVLCSNRFDANGNPTTIRTYEYNEHGNLIRFVFKDKNGRVTTDKKMRYDRNNNLVEEVDMPKKVYSILPSIDLERLANEEWKEGYRHKYFYDCDDLLFEHQIYLNGQFGVSYMYEYEC